MKSVFYLGGLACAGPLLFFLLGTHKLFAPFEARDKALIPDLVVDARTSGRTELLTYGIHTRQTNFVGTLLGLAIDIHTTTPELKKTCYMINKYAIGSVLIVGDIREVIPPGTDTRGSLEQWVTIINTLYTHCHPRPLILADFEWGPSMRIYDLPSLPKAMTCGAIQDEKLVYEYGYTIGQLCKLLSVDINLAPILDVNVNRINPVIHERSFGSDPQKVARAGLALIRGHRATGVLPCAKHFPGHGDTTVDSHKGLPIIAHDLKRLDVVELYPFVRATQAGVPCLMAGHLLVPALDQHACATLSHKILQDVCRKKLHFKGLLITDALRMSALTKALSNEEIVLRAFLAGNDILLFPKDIELAVSTLEDAITKQKIDFNEANNRAQKIFDLKKSLELEKKPLLNAQNITREAQKLVERIKPRLYRAAVTCVRDNAHLVPFVLKRNGISLALVGINERVPKILSEELFYLSARPKVFCFDDYKDREQELIQELDRCIVFALVYGIKKADHTTYGVSEKVHTWLKELGKTNRVGVVVFGTPYAARVFDYLPTVFVAYDEDPYAQQAVGKILNGQCAPTGQLPVE